MLRQDDDAHLIVHVSRWHSLARARVFFESPALVEIRLRAGVRAPRFLCLDQLDHGDL